MVFGTKETLNAKLGKPKLDSPLGTVTAYLKSLTGTPSLPIGWVECNGQTLSDSASPFNGQTIPDLNGSSATRRFLRGNSTSGGTGGITSHTHTITWSRDNEDYADGTGPVGYVVQKRVTGSASQIPTYYEVVWVMKIK